MHHQLQGTAKRQGELDTEQLELLREAERLEIWRPLGMVDMLDYMERVLGANRETARKRLRVARALGALPQLTAALRDGELAFSAVKELSRVATRATEQAWIDAARDRSLREVEELVAGHTLGDLPTDPPDPELRKRTLRFEVFPATFALARQAQLALAELHGRRLDEDEIMGAMATAVLERVERERRRAVSAGEAESTASEVDDASPERATSPGRSGDHSGRARFQIALVVCERCKQGWQEGAGARIPVDQATVERAYCDAQHVGSLEASVPERAHQDVPPSVVRFVRRRDGDRCQTPGCRSALGIEIHHIVHRAEGGSHGPSNLTLRCFACHTAHHEGKLTIRGTAPDHIITERVEAIEGSPVSTSRSPEAAILGADACAALEALGFEPAIARAAVEEAMGHVAHDTALEELIGEALRRCRGRGPGGGS